MDHKTRQIFEDLKWARENHSLLSQKYEGKWIGIYKGEVMGTLRKLDELEKRGELPVPKNEIAKYFVIPFNAYYYS